MVYLSCDPGETTGWSIWEDMERLEQGELDMIGFMTMIEERAHEWDMIIYESYALRRSSAKAMIGSEFETPQVIGVIKWVAHKNHLKVVKQSPSLKSFFDNDRLKQLDLYDRGQRHSRDSVRHALYWQYFTSKIGDLNDLIE